MIKQISDILLYKNKDVYGKFNIVNGKQPYTIEGVLLKQSGSMGELILAIGTPNGIITDLECKIVSVEEKEHANIEEYKKTINLNKRLDLEARKPYYFIYSGSSDLFILLKNNYVSIKNGEILSRYKISYETKLESDIHNKVIEIVDKVKDTNSYEENIGYFKQLGDVLNIVTPQHITELYSILGDIAHNNGFITLQLPFATKAWVSSRGTEDIQPYINEKVQTLLDEVIKLHKLTLVKGSGVTEIRDNYYVEMILKLAPIEMMSLKQAKQYVTSLKKHLMELVEVSQQTRHKMR